VRHGFDTHGQLLDVRDGATGDATWRLTDADAAGRYRKEVFGYLISGCGADLAQSHLQEVHRGKRGTAKGAKERQERPIYRE
jgi:hypothetical protein